MLDSKATFHLPGIVRPMNYAKCLILKSSKERHIKEAVED